MNFQVNFAPQGSLIELTHTALQPRKSRNFSTEHSGNFNFSVDNGELSFFSLSSPRRVSSVSAVKYQSTGEVYYSKSADLYLPVPASISSISLSDQIGKRAEVKGFSIRSRSRLNRKIAMLKKHHLPLFVTLTYGENYPLEAAEYKKHLHNFFMTLKYRFPSYGAIWKLEFQERGAAHFHLLLWGVSLEQRHQIVNIWYRIAGYKDIKVKKFHMGLLGNGNTHCVQVIRSWGGVASYSAKYLAKIDNVVDRPGRIWGVRGIVPFSAMLSFRLNMEQALEFRYWIQVHYNYEFQRLGFWCANYEVSWLNFLYDIMCPPPEPDPPPDWEFQDEEIYEQ